MRKSYTLGELFTRSELDRARAECARGDESLHSRLRALLTPVTLARIARITGQADPDYGGGGAMKPDSDRPPMAKIHALPTYDVYVADDGTVVVHVDTEHMPENERGPLIRVYLNDEVLFENPPLQGQEGQVAP